MTLSSVHHIRTWASAKRTARLLRGIAQKYQGCEVYELFPTGIEQRAVILKMEWCNEMGLEGEWCVHIRYTDNGMQSWVGCDVLRLTGEKYANVDSVVKPHRIYKDGAK